jgi:hypothetical protein
VPGSRGPVRSRQRGATIAPDSIAWTFTGKTDGALLWRVVHGNAPRSYEPAKLPRDLID